MTVLGDVCMAADDNGLRRSVAQSIAFMRMAAHELRRIAERDPAIAGELRRIAARRGRRRFGALGRLDKPVTYPTGSFQPEPAMSAHLLQCRRPAARLTARVVTARPPPYFRPIRGDRRPPFGVTP
jgi:hypothetical protein